MARKRNRAGRVEGRDQRLAALAGAQRGVVSLGQLGEVGITPRATAYRAEQGRLQRIHRGVYAVGHREVGEKGRLRAAVLACGEGALLSHGTAAALWGIRDRWPVLVDVLVPGQKGRKIDGVRCRRCRYPSAHEIVAPEGIPCTTPARTLVDLAGMAGTDSLRRAVERAAVLRRLNIDALDVALYEANGRRGISGLSRIVDEWRTKDGTVPDVRSDFEALVLPRLLIRGVPRPVCNQTLHFGSERLTVDFLWPEHWLVVETDGKETHATPVAFQRDRRRDQILVAAGYRVARATWDQIHSELESVVARIVSALESAP